MFKSRPLTVTNIGLPVVGLTFLLLGPLLYSAKDQCQPTTISHCYDGDSCTTTQNKRLRLWGIDAPEIGQPLSIEARDRVRKFVQNAEKICIRSKGLDHYKRELVVLEADGVDLNKQLLAEGLVDLLMFKGDADGSYKEAQLNAKQNKKGIWSLKNYEKPATFRKHQKNKTTLHPALRSKKNSR